MHILIISDAYPPMRTSCATQIYDLAQAFLQQSNQVSIIIPAHSQSARVEISSKDGPTIYSVRCLQTKDVNYVRRTLAEFINPFVIGFHLNRNPHFLKQKIDGITWYSPSIFWGPLVKNLKEKFHCKAYLILRDIFPDWAVDLGLMKKNVVYRLFKRVERYQYAQADCIGVQSPNNVGYFHLHNPKLASRVEVLWNWMSPPSPKSCHIEIEKTKLKGRKILIYAGNMGIAQGISNISKLITLFKNSKEIGFVFIGRGSGRAKLRNLCSELEISNTLFFDEIHPQEITSLYEQCSLGLVTLDSRHSTHNIPGKFVDYLRSGLPILALINKGNDIADIIKNNKIGLSFSSLEIDNPAYLENNIIRLLEDGQKDIRKNCYDTYLSLFNPASKVTQIINSLTNN